MLGPCWPIFRSWAPFFALGRFLDTSSVLSGRLGCFFRVLERPGLDFQGFGEGLGVIFKAPGLYFSMFFHTLALVLRKRSDPYKTMAGAVKIKVCALTFRTKIYEKSDPRAFRTKVPAKSAPKRRLETCQGRFWRGLGLSWACFGRLLMAVGRLLATLGRLLGAPGCLLDASWPLLGAS